MSNSIIKIVYDFITGLENSIEPDCFIGLEKGREDFLNIKIYFPDIEYYYKMEIKKSMIEDNVLTEYQFMKMFVDRANSYYKQKREEVSNDEDRG